MHPESHVVLIGFVPGIVDRFHEIVESLHETRRTQPK